MQGQSVQEWFEKRDLGLAKQRIEKGTEAAAATAVIVGKTSAPPPVELTADRPFDFAIIDRPTGATLFVGRVVDPSA